jgi:glycosyltransferase involved in cell wall biosynthesis
VIGQLTYGGAEGQLFELARGLAAFADPVVYCLSSATEPYGARLKDAGIPLRVLPSRGSFDLSRVKALRRALMADGIEVVHAFLFLASGYAYLATRGLRSVRLVTSARNCKPEPNPVRRAVLKASFRASARILCNSREMARYASAYYGAPAARTRVVLNGVDTARFRRPVRAHDGLRIGTVGRVEKQKNLPAFLDAAEAVLAARPDASFEIVGDGSLRAAFTEEVRRRGLAHAVTLPGTRSDIPGFFAGLDQFWLTSDWEGTPNVVLEAMAAGLPVIATKVGGTPEVVDDGVSGILVEAGDSAAVARASLALASDATASRAMGQRAAESAESRFSIDAMVRATSGLYEEALRA